MTWSYPFFVRFLLLFFSLSFFFLLFFVFFFSFFFHFSSFCHLICQPGRWFSRFTLKNWSQLRFSKCNFSSKLKSIPRCVRIIVQISFQYCFLVSMFLLLFVFITHFFRIYHRPMQNAFESSDSLFRYWFLFRVIISFWIQLTRKIVNKKKKKKEEKTIEFTLAETLIALSSSLLSSNSRERQCNVFNGT